VEPHSLSISEAVYMGCPVILSDTCGSYGDSDDVRPGINGYVFQYGNIRELADRIAALKDAALRIKFGSRSHEQAVRYQQIAHGGVLNKLLKAFQQ
jgi:glycosyltransferase involved in cell wall biosynthesis